MHWMIVTFVTVINEINSPTIFPISPDRIAVTCGRSSLFLITIEVSVEVATSLMSFFEALSPTPTTIICT